MKRGRVGFLKPSEDDDNISGYQEDRPDLDTNSQTSFVYNPYQVKLYGQCQTRLGQVSDLSFSSSRTRT